MGNTQGVERRLNSEAAHYEGDICFLSIGTGGCLSWSSAEVSPSTPKGDARGTKEWERQHGLSPVPSSSPSKSKPKRPFFVSCAINNCWIPKPPSPSSENDNQPHQDGESHGGESVFSCGCAHIGCFTPAWLNPVPAAQYDEEDDDEERQREQSVETEIARLKMREERNRRGRRSKASGDDMAISAPHPDSFRRTTDEFISSHLSMCTDPRARVSLEASAPPPPEDLWPDEFTCEEDEFSSRSNCSLAPLAPVDARGRPTTVQLPPPPVDFPSPPLPPTDD